MGPVCAIVDLTRAMKSDLFWKNCVSDTSVNLWVRVDSEAFGGLSNDGGGIATMQASFFFLSPSALTDLVICGVQICHHSRPLAIYLGVYS